MGGTAGKYRDVRALVRGIDILEALAELGWVKPSVLAGYAGIDRGSVYRLVSTLVNKGYVMRRQEDGAVALTRKAELLADGVRDDEMLSQLVAPYIRRLTEQVLWPSDFATLSGGAVTIQMSSHNTSPMSIHRRLVGRKLPALRSALGRAILSAMSPEALDATLSSLARLGGPDADDIRDRAQVRHVLRQVLEAGYASSAGLTEDNISAIALPVVAGPRTVGAVNIVFFRSAMTPAEAAARYLEALRSCVGRIEAAVRGNAVS